MEKKSTETSFMKLMKGKIPKREEKKSVVKDQLLSVATKQQKLWRSMIVNLMRYTLSLLRKQKTAICFEDYFLHIYYFACAQIVINNLYKGTCFNVRLYIYNEIDSCKYLTTQVRSFVTNSLCKKILTFLSLVSKC